jgi:hypothetical protein
VSTQIVRAFRVDTPADIWSAGVVASTLPTARNLLVLSADKTFGDREAYRTALLEAAATFTWHEVVDISDLPLSEHWLNQPTRRRYRRLRDTERSIRHIREIVEAAAHGSVDEVFVTCLQHPDVRAFVHALAAPTNAYCPHGFHGLSRFEADLYRAHVLTEATPSPESIKTRLKRRLLGSDYVIPDRVPIASAYSFNVEAPWAPTIDVRAALCDQELESRLPVSAREAIDDIRTDTASPRGMFVLVSEERDEHYPESFELGAIAELAQQVVEQEELRSLLVKPHPRNGAAWLSRVLDTLRIALPDVNVVAMTRVQEIPVEVVVGAMKVTAVFGLASSSLVTLHDLYGLASYCPEQLVRQLWGWTPELLSQTEAHLASIRGSYTSVSLSTDDLSPSAVRGASRG